jgi:hypothetical protein
MDMDEKIIVADVTFIIQASAKDKDGAIYLRQRGLK